MPEQLRFPGLDTGPNLNVRELTLSHMTPAERIADEMARELAHLFGTPRIGVPKNGVNFDALKDLLCARRTDSNSHLYLNTAGANRIGYSGTAPEVAHQISSATSYNTPDAKRGVNVNLAHMKSREFRDDALRYYEDYPTTVIIPIAREPETGAIALQYGAETTGAKHVIGITMGIDEQTQREASDIAGRTGITLLDQRAVLSCVDWKTLCKIFAIPYSSNNAHEPPKGTKGLTMLAGIIAAKTVNGHAHNGVAFVDSDIRNNAAGGYDPLAYLALPGVVDPGNDLKAVSIARTGPGRNNEVIINSLIEIAHNPRFSEDSRLTAFLMAATSAWALTGERLFPAIDGESIAFQTPWSTGMSIETQMNIYRAALELGKRGTQSAQVFNPNPKIERGISDPVREFSMLAGCADWQQRVFEFSSQIGRQLSEFTPDDIALFNEIYGGYEKVGYFVNGVHGSNIPRILKRDFMFPSVNTMIDSGLINTDQLNTYAEQKAA